MKEPVWIEATDCHAVHAQMLHRFGGLDGLRDAGRLAAALERPKNHRTYGHPSIFDLAASYAAGIIQNHPFLDGNKRTGFISAALFLETNGHRFQAPEEEVVERTFALAAGAITEEDYAAWLKVNSGASRE